MKFLNIIMLLFSFQILAQEMEGVKANACILEQQEEINFEDIFKETEVLNEYGHIIRYNAPLSAKEGGNGGGVYTCNRRLELFDFVEAKHNCQGKLKLWKNERRKSVQFFLDRAMEHIESDIPHIAVKLSPVLEHIQSKLSLMGKDRFDIPFINDVNFSNLSKDCYQNAANWHEGLQILLIDQGIYRRLNNLNKAGLIMHEAVYKVSRDSLISQTSSDLIRPVVAKIFSDEKLTDEDAKRIFSLEAVAANDFKQCHKSQEEVITAKKLITDTGKICENDKSSDLCSEEKQQLIQNLIKETQTLCLKNCRLKPSEMEKCENE